MFSLRTRSFSTLAVVLALAHAGCSDKAPSTTGGATTGTTGTGGATGAGGATTGTGSATTSTGGATTGTGGATTGTSSATTGAGGAPDASTELSFVATYLGGLQAYTLDASSGAVVEAPGSPFDPGAHLYGVAVHPAGTFVYAVDIDANALVAYRVASADGALSPVPGSPVAIAGGPMAIAVDPLGRFVFVATATSLEVRAIDAATGALTITTASPMAIAGTAFLAADPSGHFLYAARGGVGGIGAYAVDPVSGALTEIEGSPFGAGVAGAGALVFHPNGKVLYDGRGGARGYAMDAVTGALAPVPGSPFADAVGSDPFAIDLAIAPGGGFVYAVASSVQRVFAYAIDATTGAITAIPGSPFDTGSSPYSVAVEPKGRFLYVGNDNGTVSVLAIDPATGAPTKAPGSGFQIKGLQPEIVIVPLPILPSR